MNELELLKCPCCGELPKIYRMISDFDCGYWCHCARYDCDFPYALIGYDKTNAIKSWNEAVNKYRREANG